MKRKVWIGVFTLFLAILITAGLVYKNPGIYYKESKEYKVELPVYDKETMGDIVGKRDAEQTFLSEEDTINAISVGVFSNDRENNCHATVELKDLSTNEICESWTFDGSRIPRCTYVKFELKKPLTKTKGKQYKIRVYSEDASYGNAISVIADLGAKYPDGDFYIAGKKMSGAMMVSVTYAMDKSVTYHNTANVIRMGITIWIYILLLVLAVWQAGKIAGKLKMVIPAFWKEKSREKRAVWYHLILGIVGICIMCVLFSCLLNVILTGSVGWNYYYFIWCMGFVVTGFFVYLLCRRDGKRAEQFFLIIALIAGIVYVLGGPVTTRPSWDDKVHYSNVQSLSHIVKNPLTKADYYMNNTVLPITFDLQSVEKYKKELNASYYGAENIVEESTRTYYSVYKNFGYLPGAVAHMVGRFFHLPYVMIFYMGKLANLFLYVAVVYAAIKRLHSGKWILTTMALFPTLIFIASNYSYDYWVNAWTMYGFAYIFSVMEEKKKIGFTDFVKILGSFFLGLGPKAIYFPILLFGFFIPEQCFSSKKENYSFKVGTILVMLIVVSSFMVDFVVRGPGQGDMRGGGGVNATQQVQFILQNPLEYTKILLRFLFEDYLRIKNSNDYTNYMYTLGYSIFGSVSMFLVFLTMHFDHPKKKVFNWKYRTIGGILLFGTVCLVATALYISYTTVGLDTIVGCQYRYLLPVLFPVFMLAGYYTVSSALCARYNPQKLLPFYVGLQVIILYVSAFLCFVGKYA